MNQEIWLLSNLNSFSITMEGSMVTFPILLIQKLQFVIIMLSIALALHVPAKKKLRYLAIVPSYWGFVMVLDLVVASILFSVNIPTDSVALGSLLLVLSSYFGSIVMLYTIFTTANLPAPVNVKQKFKIERKYYYALIIAATVAILVDYAVSVTVFIPVIYNFEDFDISVALLAVAILGLFRITLLGMGYAIGMLDKPPRSDSYIPKVTIIIPAKNEEERIAQAIRSADIMASNYKGSVELLVVNDKSTDRTQQVAEEEIRNSKYLEGKVILGPGEGKSAGLNLARSYAKGDLILGMDADVDASPSTLKDMVPYFIDPKVGGVGVHMEQKTDNEILRKMAAIDMLFVFGLVKPAQQGFDSVMVIAGGMTMYRKHVLDELGGWAHIKVGDDGDMTLRAGRAGYKIIQHNEKTLARSEIPESFPEWFLQRTRWVMSFFYTHSRNRTSISLQQGIRGKVLMPLLYVRSFNTFTTFLWLETMFFLTSAFALRFGIPSYEIVERLFISLLPFIVPLLLLVAYYKKFELLGYFAFFPIYRYIIMLANLRALLIVMGDEPWDSRATTVSDIVSM
jgi:cellulose synthase/poly-beta-1,6-N-acetylglucosamine synthase-like glycosyltransferase